VYRGADRIDEAAVRIGSEVNGNISAWRDPTGDFYVEYDLPVGAT
jgi:hypothetical protein